MNKNLARISRRLAFYLRHAPDRIGLSMSADGYVPVTDLLTALAREGMVVTRTELDEVVATNDKQRFAFDGTGTRIRANQGHSVPVNLNLPTAVPPAVLYHGTVGKFLAAIQREGLRPMGRHHVHLSATADTAIAVGTRRGKPVVLRVDAAAMAEAGHEFLISANGVWLVDHVPPAYLSVHYG